MCSTNKLKLQGAVGGKSAENPGGGENVKTRQRDGQQRKNAAKRKYCGTISFFFFVISRFFVGLFLINFFYFFFFVCFSRGLQKHTHTFKASSPAGYNFRFSLFPNAIADIFFSLC